MQERARQLERINLVLRAIRNVNQLLVKENDRGRLIQDICDTLVEDLSYYNAWIALFDESGGLVATAEAGLGEEFLPMIKQLKRGELTSCTQRALMQSKVVVTEDPISACKNCPLSEKYSARGGVTVRLEHNEKVYGVLYLSMPKRFVQDQEELDLVKEVAKDVAFAINNIEMQDERKRIEEALSLDESRLEALLKLIKMTEASTQEITNFSLEEAVRLTKSKLGYLAFTNADETVLTMYSWSKNAMKQCAMSDKPSVYSVETTGLWGEPLRQRKPIIINDYSAFNPLKKGYPKGHIKLTRHMIIPVFDGERIVAVAGVGNKGAEYDESDVRQITLLMQGMWQFIQRQQANVALRESEERFRTLVENSMTGISIIQDNQIVYQNPEQQKLLGPLPRSPKLEDLKSIHPDDAEKVKEFNQSITSRQFQTLDMDFRFYYPSKMNSKPDMKWVNCRAIKIEYQGKEAVLVNMTDITKTKAMEHLLSVQDKMTSLGRVAAGIAHEIRNPLSGINVYLDTLQNIYDKEESLEKVKRIIEQLQSASNKIKSVIKRVMDFSQPSAPKYALIDINQPIVEAFNLSSVTMRKSGTRIERNLTENLPLCRADPRLIEEVVLNLLNNAGEALKNVDGYKKIEVVSYTDNNRIVVKVSDSGSGVPPNVGDQIFDPFYTTKDGGTGIGLSISHRIITDHGGSLSVSVSKLGGAEFIIEIPIKRK